MGQTKADKDRIALRRAHSIKLRCQGLSYREIAKVTGVSHGMAWLDCKAVLDEAAEHRRGTWG